MGLFGFNKKYSEKDFEKNSSAIQTILLGMQKDNSLSYAHQIHAAKISARMNSMFSVGANMQELERIDGHIFNFVKKINAMSLGDKTGYKYFDYLEYLMGARGKGTLDKSDEEIARTLQIFEKEASIMAKYDEISKVRMTMQSIVDVADTVSKTEFEKLDLEYGRLETNLSSMEANVAILVNAYNALVDIQNEEADGKILDEAVQSVPVEEYARLVESNNQKSEAYTMRMDMFNESKKSANDRRSAQKGMATSSGLQAKVDANRAVNDFEAMSGTGQARAQQSSLRDKLNNK